VLRMKKAVFLDRDGVINKKRSDYVKSINEFVMLKDVPTAIKLLNNNDFLVIVVTNQSAVNRDYISREELENIHKFLSKQLQKQNSHIDAIYYCPHRPDENCDCRKPKTKLISKAIKDFSIDKNSSWLIGDNETDIQAAKSIGIKSIKMETDASLLECVKEKIINS